MNKISSFIHHFMAGLITTFVIGAFPYAFIHSLTSKHLLYACLIGGFLYAINFFEYVYQFLKCSKNNNWIDATIKTPPLIDKENYSENVWAICNGELMIMCYCYIPGEDGGFVWANCGGNIHGDAEFDDDYEVTHWQPFPKLPKK